MNAMSMESIFLVLSGAVLAAGILYWFWSHIQLTQKKVQLLENAVFELRGMQGPGPGPKPSEDVRNVPVYRDVDDGEWDQDQGQEEQDQEQGLGNASTPLTALDSTPVDLQPGGRIEVVEEKQADRDSQFRELFIQHEPRIQTPIVTQVASTGSALASSGVPGSESLDAMPVKELRRLAEQRGLTGVSDMRKKELLSALRNQVAAPSGDAGVKAEEEERTLDLTDEVVALE